uniref:gluconokinase n=2 Tax=Canis lupus familiaris TaxID=9615 RepID=A0A8I3N2D3_CANLF
MKGAAAQGTGTVRGVPASGGRRGRGDRDGGWSSGCPFPHLPGSISHGGCHMGHTACHVHPLTLLLKLGWKFYDADDYHPEENRTKMGKGIPLNDQAFQPPAQTRIHPKARKIITSSNPAFWKFPIHLKDRIPWLCNLHDILLRDVASGQHVVLACSGLKKMYRDILIRGKDGTPLKSDGTGKDKQPAEVKLLVVHLNGSFEVISGRLLKRKGHFMPPELLQSQFDTLEPPSAPENFIQISVDKNLSEIIATIVDTLR